VSGHAYVHSPEFAKFINKMKNNKLYTVRTDPTFNQIIVEKGKYNPSNAHMHDRSLDWHMCAENYVDAHKTSSTLPHF
jgi:hypothetical protein